MESKLFSPSSVREFSFVCLLSAEGQNTPITFHSYFSILITEFFQEGMAKKKEVLEQMERFVLCDGRGHVARVQN